MSYTQTQTFEEQENLQVITRVQKKESDTIAQPSWFNSLLEKCNIFFTVYIKEALQRSTVNNFHRTFAGHVFFEAMYAATNFDLFTLLDNIGPSSIEAIAAELGIQKQPCRILLMNLAASGLLQKNGDHYKNTFVSKRFLSSNSNKSIIAYVKLQHHLYYKTNFHFYESIVQNKNVGLCELKGTGDTVYQRLEDNPELQKIFQQAMQELSRQSNNHLASYVDLSDVNYLVDVGGGNGTNIIALAERNPHMKAAVYDFPGVIKIADKNIASQQISNRLSTITGDCFRDAFPVGPDCFIFCHFFTMWSLEEDQLLLEKAYKVLPKGGKVIIFNMMQDNDGKGPLTAALGSPYFLSCATGRGMLYSWNDYIGVFKKAGFTKIKTKRLPVDHGMIIGIKE